MGHPPPDGMHGNPCRCRFSICGCEMQTILGNPMASPYTLGISAAAAFGAAAGIILDINILGIPSNLLVTANSFYSPWQPLF